MPEKFKSEQFESFESLPEEEKQNFKADDKLANPEKSNFTKQIHEIMSEKYYKDVLKKVSKEITDSLEHYFLENLQKGFDIPLHFLDSYKKFPDEFFLSTTLISSKRGDWRKISRVYEENNAELPKFVINEAFSRFVVSILLKRQSYVLEDDKFEFYNNISKMRCILEIPKDAAKAGIKQYEAIKSRNRKNLEVYLNFLYDVYSFGLIDREFIQDLIKGKIEEALEVKSYDTSDIMANRMEEVAGIAEIFEIPEKEIEDILFDLAQKIKNFGKFKKIISEMGIKKKIPEDMFHKFIASDESKLIAESLSLFDIKNYQLVAENLLQYKQEKFLAKNLELFKELNQNIASDLVNKGFLIVHYLDRFSNLNQEFIKQNLIKILDDADTFIRLCKDLNVSLDDQKKLTKAYVLSRFQEIQARLQKEIDPNLHMNIQDLENIQEKFSFSQEIFNSPEIQGVGKSCILYFLEPHLELEEGVDVVANIEAVRNLCNITNDFFEGKEVIKELGQYYPEGMSYEELKNLYNTPSVGRFLVEALSFLNFLSFKKHVKPIISAQGEAAYLFFQQIKFIEGWYNLLPEDVEYITIVGKKYGTRARNILENILAKVDSIGGEREIIEEYIRDIGIVHFDIYQEFKKAKEENNPDKLAELKEKTKGLHNKIYKGEMAEKDFKDKLYPAVSYHTFPPAIGITQDQYNQLNQERPDRRMDVPKELDELQYQQFELETGKYSLGEGKELNLEKWSVLGEAVKKVNEEAEREGKAAINEEKIAERLIKMYKEKSQEQKENQNYLFESMYRYHLNHDGGKLESGFEISMQGLMNYKEFIGDRIKNDLIKDCLKKWSESHPEEFEELKKDALNRMKSAQAQNISKVKNMLKGIEKQKDESGREKAIKNLDEFLKHFNLSYETVKGRDIGKLERELEAVIVEYSGDLTEENYRTEEYYNSEEFLSAYDDFVEKHNPESLVYQKISSDLISPINRKMRKEIDKFEFKSEEGAAEKQKLEFAISKKKEHGVAGYNMGVCVTPDEKLWNDPEFMNCVIFDPELKQAMGGVHFLIRENCLCLPGINPALDVLGSVKNEDLFNKIIDYAKQVKEKLGLEKVLIPDNSTIYSNRTQIQDIVRNKNYKKHILKKEAEFSYDPYEYSFQECFEVPT